MADKIPFIDIDSSCTPDPDWFGDVWFCIHPHGQSPNEGMFVGNLFHFGDCYIEFPDASQFERKEDVLAWVAEWAKSHSMVVTAMTEEEAKRV